MLIIHAVLIELICSQCINICLERDDSVTYSMRTLPQNHSNIWFIIYACAILVHIWISSALAFQMEFHREHVFLSIIRYESLFTSTTMNPPSFNFVVAKNTLLGTWQIIIIGNVFVTIVKETQFSNALNRTNHNECARNQFITIFRKYEHSKYIVDCVFLHAPNKTEKCLFVFLICPRSQQPITNSLKCRILQSIIQLFKY